MNEQCSEIDQQKTTPKRTGSQLERYQQSLLIVILILLALIKIK